eukprot:TRINITY_DN39057_c0_g2_i2.p1 TRINITY_DN39057_c0_g2~~TRINITY_DN39057_c0_g2_i2.p1  ORF type:complete len:102 (+),score=13.31 TRINITY_DN39057_c0_g2_i2:16-321(+)
MGGSLLQVVMVISCRSSTSRLARKLLSCDPVESLLKPFDITNWEKLKQGLPLLDADNDATDPWVLKGYRHWALFFELPTLDEVKKTCRSLSKFSHPDGRTN